MSLANSFLKKRESYISVIYQSGKAAFEISTWPRTSQSGLSVIKCHEVSEGLGLWKEDECNIRVYLVSFCFTLQH